MTEEEFTFQFDDIPKEKYVKLEILLHSYMDGEMSRDTYILEVKKLFKE